MQLARVAVQVRPFHATSRRLFLGLLGAAPHELGIALDAAGVGDPVGIGDDSSVAANDRPSWQIQFAPPGDVGGVTKGTDHRDAGALFGVGQVMSENRDLDPEQRCGHRRRAKQVLVALIRRVGDQGHTGRQAALAGWCRS